MSFFTDNYQWVILVSISFSALIATIIGIVLRRKKQPKIKVHHIIMNPITKITHPASSPDICNVNIRIKIINVGNYQTATKIIFKIKFDSIDDQGKKIFAENHTSLSKGLELGKEQTMVKDLYPHKNAIAWKKAKVIIFAKYNKTSGREVKRRIGCKRFKR